MRKETHKYCTRLKCQLQSFGNFLMFLLAFLLLFLFIDEENGEKLI